MLLGVAHHYELSETSLWLKLLVLVACLALAHQLNRGGGIGSELECTNFHFSFSNPRSFHA